MANLRLQPPEVYERENSVFVCIKHEPLASVEATIMEYLNNHANITNKIARHETGIQSEGTIKEAFYRLKDRQLIELVLGRSKKTAAWCKFGIQDENLENENSLYKMYPQYEQLVINNLKNNQLITKINKKSLITGSFLIFHFLFSVSHYYDKRLKPYFIISLFFLEQ